MAYERECKIPVEDHAPLEARLSKLHAERVGRHHEQNWVLDTPRQDLYAKKMLLRLRRLDDASAGLLTVKRPAPSAAFKVYEELEVDVDDAARARAMLAALGYEEQRYYEKMRTLWRHGGCLVALDRLPELGAFVEVEGPDDPAIRRVLIDLGLDPADHVPENYLTLFAQHCAANDRPAGDMRFAASAKDLT